MCAADIAKRNGDAAIAARYLATADAWQRSIERWTVTTNGPLSADPYYLRITANGDANSGRRSRSPTVARWSTNGGSWTRASWKSSASA